MARPKVIIADEDANYIVPLQFKFVTDFFNKIDLEIIDDGIGFNEETAQRAKLNHHLGLRSMQKRIELLQGEFEIISKMNEGTIIKIVIPVENIPTRENFDYE